MGKDFRNSMTTRVNHVFIVLSLFSTPLLGQAASNSSIAGTPGAPLRMGFGGRGIGFGNAMTAVNVGDISSYYNPALAPFQHHPFASASFGVLPLDRSLNFISYTQSLKPSAGVSFGIINSGVSNIDGRDRDGIPTEKYSTSENAFFFSFGLKASEHFALGVSAKLLYYSLYEGLRSTTVGLDFGVLYQLAEEIAIAGVFQDVNSKYVWDTSKLYGRSGNATTDKFPLRKKIGLSYLPSALSLLIASEIEFVGSEAIVRLGTEISLAEGLQIRAGLDQMSLSQNMDAKPSFGLSFQTDDLFWRPSIHYSFVFEPYVSTGFHIISLGVVLE